MKTPSQLKAFSRLTLAPIVLKLNLARLLAESERKRVDAYILPFFNSLEFMTNPEMTGEPAERITKPDELYLCGDKEKVAQYFADCDRLHKEHGSKLPDGYCPALVAEHAVIDAENELLIAGGEFFEAPFIETWGEKRDKALELLEGSGALALKEAA